MVVVAVVTVKADSGACDVAMVVGAAANPTITAATTTILRIPRCYHNHDIYCYCCSYYHGYITGTTVGLYRHHCNYYHW